MKNYIILILWLVFNVNILYAKGPITYVVSDSIEVCIGEYLMDNPTHNRIGFYIYSRNDRILISIISIPRNSKSIIKEYLDRSNRVILIGEKEFPLLFDYDFDFGTKTPIKNIGNYGNRNGTYLRSQFLSNSKTFEIKGP